MSTAILRGNKAVGYRTVQPLECPHCGQPVDVSGRADTDKQGPHLLLWPVAAREGGYTRRELDYVINGPPTIETGVALPQRPRNAPFYDDPVPRFDGSDGT